MDSSSLANKDLKSDKDICSGKTYTALRPSSPLTFRGAGVRIHIVGQEIASPVGMYDPLGHFV